MNLTQKFLDVALLGAEWVLWLLVALSVISVYVMLERILFFRAVSRADAGVKRSLRGALAEGDFDQAEKLVRNSEGTGSRIVAEMLHQARRGRAGVESGMQSVRAEEKIRLERNLAFLGTLGANAPFIGLFGTVLGIIQAFNELSRSGISPGGQQSASVMAGISEALVATAVGLLVAIPAVVAYNVFQRRVKRTLAESDGLSNATLASILAHDDADKDTDGDA